MPTAVVTGASRGLGAATADALARRGYHLVVDARDAAALESAARDWTGAAGVDALAGDVTDPDHRRALIEAAAATGRLDVLVNNASTLGPSPRPALRDVATAKLRGVHEVNALAPLALFQQARWLLHAVGGAVINLTSDVAAEALEGWGVYGSSKAALEHLTSVLAAEEPVLDVYALDPGDLRTVMHEAAFPDEDISDRPEPATAVPALLALLDQRPAGGRYRATQLLATAGGIA